MFPYGNMLAVTNRHLCDGPFLAQVERVAAKKPRGIILREKDLEASEYLELAEKVQKICRKYGVACILHSRIETAQRLACSAVHLPFSGFCSLSDKGNVLEGFDTVGVSVHSVKEAVAAERMGAGYVTAGHIFLTDCKKGLPARGIHFLKNVCTAVRIPVYAIGGINPDNVKDVLDAGAAGFCVMSGIMRGPLWR